MSCENWRLSCDNLSMLKGIIIYPVIQSTNFIIAAKQKKRPTKPCLYFMEYTVGVVNKDQGNVIDLLLFPIGYRWYTLIITLAPGLAYMLYFKLYSLGYLHWHRDNRCPGADEVPLKDMSKRDEYQTTTKTQKSKNRKHIPLGVLCATATLTSHAILWYQVHENVANIGPASSGNITYNKHYDNTIVWRTTMFQYALCLCYCYPMITSSNGDIFGITGHLCGEFAGHRWIPHTKASDAELWCVLWSAPE